MIKSVLLFPGFKTKALTFSFDDGIDSDIETLELLKKYDIKATFKASPPVFPDISSPIRAPMNGPKIIPGSPRKSPTNIPIPATSST